MTPTIVFREGRVDSRPGADVAQAMCDEIASPKGASSARRLARSTSGRLTSSSGRRICWPGRGMRSCHDFDVNVILTRSADELAERAEALLESRIEHNVLATVLDHVRACAAADDLFAIIETAGGDACGVAMRVGGRRMMASVMDEPSASRLIEAWLEIDPGVPGVAAPAGVARAIAKDWERRTGGRSALVHAMGLHTLDRLKEPARPAPGLIRPAQAADRPRLIEWMRDFIREAGIEDEAVQMVDRQRPLYLWEDDEPVSVVGLSPAVAGVARVGPVYTPPPCRARGYASSAVAAVSKLALAAGARSCILFTDLANPTSNGIYAALGYRRAADWEERSFTAQ